MRPGNLLFTVNFSAGVGYAWRHIETTYARLADRLAPRGIRTFVAYPRIPAPPDTLEGSAAEAVALDTSLESEESLEAFPTFVRDRSVRVVYMTDRPYRHLRYPALRRAGVEEIVVHDHTSGHRDRPRGVKRLAKWGLARIPWIHADRVVAVSEFVRRRQLEVSLVPPSRVTRIHNGLDLDELAEGVSPSELRTRFELPEEAPIIACASRATPEKGIHHLLRAFDRLRAAAREPAPVLLYLGDGPQFEELREIRTSLSSTEAIHMPGYQEGAVALLAGADVVAIPSVWQDALPLSVLEPLALGKPVVATRVGGIPEMVVDGECGLLVPPGDEPALAEAIEHLLDHPDTATRFGRAARTRVAGRFSLGRQLDRMERVILDAFGIQVPPEETTAPTEDVEQGSPVASR